MTELNESLDKPLEFKRTEGTLPVYVADEWEFTVNSQKQVVRFIRGSVYGKRTTIVSFGRKVGKSLVKKYDGISNMREYFATIFAIFEAAADDPTMKMKNKTDGFVVLIPEKVWEKYGQRFARIFRMKFMKRFSYAVNYFDSLEEGQDAFYFWKKGKPFASVYNNIKSSDDLKVSDETEETTKTSDNSIKNTEDKIKNAVVQSKVEKQSEKSNVEKQSEMTDEEFAPLDRFDPDVEKKIKDIMLTPDMKKLPETQKKLEKEYAKNEIFRKKLEFIYFMNFYMEDIYYYKLKLAEYTFHSYDENFLSESEKQLAKSIVVNGLVEHFYFPTYSNNQWADDSKLNFYVFLVDFHKEPTKRIILRRREYEKILKPETYAKSVSMNELFEIWSKWAKHTGSDGVANLLRSGSKICEIMYDPSETVNVDNSIRVSEIMSKNRKKMSSVLALNSTNDLTYEIEIENYITENYSSENLENCIFLAKTCKNSKKLFAVESDKHTYAQNFLNMWFKTAGSSSQTMAHRALNDFKGNANLPKFWNYIDSDDHAKLIPALNRFSADVALKRRKFIHDSIEDVYNFTQKKLKSAKYKKKFGENRKMRLYRGVSLKQDKVKYYSPGALECWTTRLEAAQDFSGTILVADVPFEYILLVNEIMLEDSGKYNSAIMKRYKDEKECIVMGGAFASTPLYEYDYDSENPFDDEISIVTEWLLNESVDDGKNKLKIMTPDNKRFKELFDEIAKGNSLEELLGNKKKTVYNDEED